MPLTLQPVTREEIPSTEKVSKWRDLLEAFEESGQDAARVSLDGETNRDGKPLTAQSAQAGLSTARKSSNGRFDNIGVSQRSDAVYLVRKDGDEAEASDED